MVKLAPIAVPMPPPVPALRPADPTQTFEAALAAAGETDLQSRPGTLEFGALGMLGRHGAVASRGGQPAEAPGFDPGPAAPAPGAVSDPQPTATAPVARLGAAAAAASPPVEIGPVSGPDRRPSLATLGLVSSAQPITGEQPSARLRLNAGSLAERAAAASRPRPAENGRPTASPVRIDVADAGNRLQLVVIAPGLAGEDRQHLRNRLADVAAELGLHLADFTLNGHTVRAPGVGALGATHGRNPG